MTNVPVSILDLALVGREESVRDGLEGSVLLAQRAEQLGYLRVWYAEHHNMSVIASSATAVLIAHIAANTERIRVGSGGIMLPNHAPLTIAEQFGTLEALHPGRIDLGVGRAPGTDQVTLRALRRDPSAADTFPQDVVELQGFLSDESLVAGVRATPGAGAKVPLYILGSSLFGAQLAALLGLPYAFASHFAPDALQAAVARYREDFRPSAQLERPHVIAGVNVIAADTETEAQEQLLVTRRARARRLFARGGEPVNEDDADRILASPQGAFVDQMLRYTAVGTPPAVTAYLDEFVVHADADELMVVHQTPSIETRLRSLELTAEAVELEAS